MQQIDFHVSGMDGGYTDELFMEQKPKPKRYYFSPHLDISSFTNNKTGLNGLESNITQSKMHFFST